VAHEVGMLRLMFNPLKMKRMFYIRPQCVPRCKHSPLRL
jgi:hypothetical protein